MGGCANGFGVSSELTCSSIAPAPCGTSARAPSDWSTTLA